MGNDSFVLYASVILDLAVDKPLDYGLTVDQAAIAKKGMRVEVPVRGHQRYGYIYEIKNTPSYPSVKGVNRFISDGEMVSNDLFDLATWMAKYYCVTLRDAIQVMLPAVVRKDKSHKQQLFVMRAKTREQVKEHIEKIRNKASCQAEVLDVMLQVKKGILLSELLDQADVSRSSVDALVKQGFLAIDIVRVDRSPLVSEEYFQTKPKRLNGEQAVALDRINSTLQEGQFQTHLLYGVTGSGKTEVYIQAIEKALSLGKGAIVLVPEIELTAQTIERFRSRFDSNIAILHHRLSQGERFDEWHRIRRGDANIVIGARSAVFSPVRNLGLIVVDEEHEPSYKQGDSAPCYHAREVAVMRGKISSCAVVLGSATPSIESYYNAVNHKYILTTLGSRADAASMPTFRVVDMKREYEKSGGYTNFSDELLEGIKKRQGEGFQTILFLNRRGYHTTLFCQSCSEAVRCRHCDVGLTFHLGHNSLACHLCGYQISPPPKCCPSCKSEQTMKFRGVGTEQVERSLHAVLPEVRTMRIDADTTKHKGSLQRLLKEFATGKADVLIGTQMIAKGLHFPQVTLVGVLNTDASLNIPDFRASETVYQLITQVAGRAGRGYAKGEVIVQTCLPDNQTIALASKGCYETFYNEEVDVRKLFSYPPFASFVKLTFSGKEEKRVKIAAERFRLELQKLLLQNFELMPVVPSGHAKVKDMFRFQLLIRGPGIYPISHAIADVQEKHPVDRTVHLLVDVNPISTFF